MVWVNIDKPTKKYTVHTSHCIYVGKLSETPYKGVNRLKRDGGWIQFDTPSNAVARHQLQYSDYELIQHC